MYCAAEKSGKKWILKLQVIHHLSIGRRDPGVPVVKFRCPRVSSALAIVQNLGNPGNNRVMHCTMLAPDTGNYQQYPVTREVRQTNGQCALV